MSPQTDTREKKSTRLKDVFPGGRGRCWSVQRLSLGYKSFQTTVHDIQRIHFLFEGKRSKVFNLFTSVNLGSSDTFLGFQLIYLCKPSHVCLGGCSRWPTVWRLQDRHGTSRLIIHNDPFPGTIKLNHSRCKLFSIILQTTSVSSQNGKLKTADVFPCDSHNLLYTIISEKVITLSHILMKLTASQPIVSVKTPQGHQ